MKTSAIGKEHQYGEQLLRQFYTISAFRNLPKRAGVIKFFQEFIPEEIIAISSDPDSQGIMRYLHRARTLQDLRQPPGNQLEALKGDRYGQYSVRVNDQRWICFTWSAGDVYDVEIVDYH